MKCRDVRPWLFGAAAEAVPPPVQRHLQRCPRCSRRQGQLALLDRCARQLAPPSASPRAREQLRRRLDEAPRLLPPAPHGGRRPLLQRLLAVAAACLLLAVGWLLGRAMRPGDATPPTGSPGETGGPVVQAAPLLPRVAGRDVVLAGAADAGEQLEALAGLAEDLRGEAFRSAREGSRDETALAVALYDRVVRRGLPGRARALPAAERRHRLPALVAQLHAAEADLERTRPGLLPATEELLRPLQQASRAGTALLEAGQVAEAEPLPPVNGGQPLLAALVSGGLRLAEESDPLRRAEVSSALAGLLAQAIVLLSARGDAEQADELGTAMGELLYVGVTSNLDRVAATAPPGARAAEAEQVRRRAAQAQAVLEQNLEQATGPARAGLQRALQASRHGAERAAQGGPSKGKSKGPPWLRDNPEEEPKGKGRPPHGKPPDTPGKGKKNGKGNPGKGHGPNDPDR